MELQRLTTVFNVDTTGLQTARVQVDAYFSDAEKRASDSVSRFDRISRDIGKTIGTGIKVGLGDIGAGVDALINITEKGLKGIPLIGEAASAAFKESAGAMRDAINEGFAFDDMMKRNRISLGLIAGGANDATKELAGLRSISSNSEFGLPALVGAAEQLQIMQGNAHNVVPEIQAIADAASALGRGEGGLNAIVNVLARINEMGKVDTRAARQLINAGIPAFDILGEAAGMSSQRAKRLLDTGRVQIDTFTDAILGYFQRKYPQAAAQMAQTMEVQNAKLASGWASLKGTAFLDDYNKGLQAEVGLNAALRGPEAGKIAANVNASSQFMLTLFTKTLDAAKSGNLIGKFEELGADAVKSAAKGIVANETSLYAAGSNAFAKLEQGWRDEAKQHSPSQVMYDLGFDAALSAHAGFNAGITAHRFSDEIEKAIKEAAEAFKISPELIRAVIEQESHGNRKAVSPKGAQGLMQLMPATASRYGVTNPFDVEQNVMGGTHYLADLLKQFGDDVKLALAAYNSGERNVQKYGGIPPFKETRNYVNEVSGNYSRAVDGPVPVTVTNLPALALGHTPPGAGGGGFAKLSAEDQLKVIRGLLSEGFGYSPGDLQGGYGKLISPPNWSGVDFSKLDATLWGGASPRLNPSLNIDLNQPQPTPSFLPLPAIDSSASSAMRELAMTTALLESQLDGVTNKQHEAFGEKAQRELRGFRGAMLELGLDMKSVGDSFESNFISAFDHNGEAGHNFGRELALGIVQDLKHNVGQYLAGELRDDIFGTADGKKKGLLGGLEDKIAKLFGGGKGVAGGQDSSITANTVQVTTNTTATQLNTDAITRLTGVMSAGGKALPDFGEPKGGVNGIDSSMHELTHSVEDINNSIGKVSQDIQIQGFNTVSAIHELSSTMQSLIPPPLSFGKQLLLSAVGGLGSAFGAYISGGGGSGSNDEGPVGPRPTTPPVLKHRAFGGPASAGEVYQIHEQGLPEFFRPNVSGEVIPLSRMGSNSQPREVHHYHVVEHRLPRQLAPDTIRTPVGAREMREAFMKLLVGRR
jgi:tape measure domain-containing protein